MSERHQKSPLDVAADVLVFAPVGLAIELGKQVPELARQGREHLNGPIRAARFMGNVAAMQGRREFGEKLRKATEPFFAKTATGAPSPAAAPRPAPPSPASPTEKSDLPIAGYETLSASQIVSHLSGLSPEDLSRVGAYEMANRSRKTILARIDHLLDPTS